MVLEVVSDSSRRKDLVEHVTDYALAGIREYWIADARTDDLVFRILQLSSNGVYVDVSPDADGWLRSPLWGRGFKVRRLAKRAGIHDFILDISE
jgi:Uma2 family endonuclease